jgi:ACS family hexuronate transporter-like MFS transporter
MQKDTEVAVMERQQAMTLGSSYRKLRWFIVAWITVSTVLNLLDRQGLYVLAPVLRQQFSMSIESYSKVVSFFLLAYAVMYTVGGRIVDWIGERVALAVFVTWWSLWTMLTSLVQGVFGLGAVQFLAGLGEPGNYPAGLRAMTTWFSKEERGLPIAIFSSGSALGNAIAAPLIAAITLTAGWRVTFVIIGSLGLVWTVVWLWIYRAPAASVTPDTTQAASPKPEPPACPGPSRWIDLLKNRKVLGLVLARLVSDPVWWFFVAFTPEYLKSQRGFSLKEIGLYAWIPFVAGTLGGMLGGGTSDRLIRKGMNAARARLRVLYISAAFAPLGILISGVPSAGMAIALIAGMALVVYSWFINTAALIPDVLPENVVGSVLGLMGTAGSLGGFLFTRLVGFLLTHYSYAVVFVLAGSMHLMAAVILWAFMRERTS